jgi:hypothetical protein
MSTNFPLAGYGFAPNYQISGLPFVFSVSPVLPAQRSKIEFPYVTQWICFRFVQAPRTAYVSFDTSGNLTPNILKLEATSNADLFHGPYFLRIKDIYIEEFSDAVQIIAGLTSIPRETAPELVSSVNSFVTGSLSPIDTNYFIYPGI